MATGLKLMVIVAGVALCTGLTACDDLQGKESKPAQPGTAEKPAKPAGTPEADKPKSDQAGTPPAPKLDPSRVNPPLKTEPVTISGKKFDLELAVNPDSRQRGLTGRTEIAPDGGMLFVFPRPQTTSFVMRDCFVPIDIIFLDASGRIINMHEMKVEPRREGEGDDSYEDRLTKYPSQFDTQYVIELKGGSIKSLGLKKYDKIKLDFAKLKKLAT